MVAFPHCSVFDLTEIVEEAAAETLFDCCNGMEVACDVGEAFFFSDLGGVCVEFHTFEFFFACCCGQIFGCGADDSGVDIERHLDGASLKELEEYFSMAQLIGGGFSEHSPIGKYSSLSACDA